MRITDCLTIDNATVLVLDEDLPLAKWHAVVIDGKRYVPRMIMDAGSDVVGVEGKHGLVGKKRLLRIEAEPNPADHPPILPFCTCGGETDTMNDS